MDCRNALNLIPSYQDGELSEEQAAPLRQHLLDCFACRERAKDEVSLKRWFEPAPAVAAPAGFAAHVARRAFAGDDGLREVTLRPRPAASGDTVLSFVLKLTAVAAAALMVLAIGLRSRSLPESDDLDATSLSETLEYMKALNEAEMDTGLNLDEPSEEELATDE